jgi:hypothetical protein
VLRKIFDSVYSPKCVERLYEKSSNTGEPPRHEANHGSMYQRLAARTQPLVVPKLILLCSSIQDSVRSTMHLLGNSTKPLGGISLCQSRATLSLAHSLAHLINTSSGAGFFGRCTRSTLQPRVFLTQSAPLFSPRASQSVQPQRCRRRGNRSAARCSSVLIPSQSRSPWRCGSWP